MSDIFDQDKIAVPNTKFKDLPEPERRLILAILAGFMRGKGIVKRYSLGIEGTLEMLISMSDKGMIKINPSRERKSLFEVYSYDLKEKQYILRAEIELKDR